MTVRHTTHTDAHAAQAICVDADIALSLRYLRRSSPERVQYRIRGIAFPVQTSRGCKLATMPRGEVGGSTAALIAAAAAEGVEISAYQIERWRAQGALPRAVRHGLGQGHGTRARHPDEATIQQAILLGRNSRQGVARPGGHIIERFALGLPVAEDQVRAAFAAQLDAVARLTAADVQGVDAGWQARQSAADRAAGSPYPLTSVRWSEFVDAIDGKEMAAPPESAQRRAALDGMIHAVGAGAEATGEDLAAMVATVLHLSEQQLESLRRAQQEAELRGEDLLEVVAQAISVNNLRSIVRTVSIADLQRATAAPYMISMMEGLAVLIGLPNLAGQAIELPAPLNRFNGQMIRRMQADPMFGSTVAGSITPRPRYRIRSLVMAALGLLLAPEQLEETVAYERRLRDLTGWGSPHPHR